MFEAAMNLANPLGRAAMAGEAMAQNMMDEDTSRGIDAFLEERKSGTPRNPA